MKVVDDYRGCALCRNEKTGHDWDILWTDDISDPASGSPVPTVFERLYFNSS
jgi:hypothetical protein